MSDYTTRYYQLTSDILIEYNYATEGGTDNKISVDDLGLTRIIKNNNTSSKYHLISKNYGGINLYDSNFVMSVNDSGTQFIKPLHFEGSKPKFEFPYDNKKISTSVSEKYYNTDGNSFSMSFDSIRIHFTSGNYMRGYDALIFESYVYDNQKNKIFFMSFLLDRMDNLTMNESHMIINQRRYTSYIDVKIPSVYKILKSYDTSDLTNSTIESIIYNQFKNNLGITNSDRIMENASLNFNLYGVKHVLKSQGYEYYLTENIGTNTIPSKDTYGDLYVDIRESNDGDYFEIQTKVTDGSSFSDYVYRMDDNPDIYIILHDIKLIEHVITNDNAIVEKATHSQQFVVNATSSYLDEHDNRQVDINSQMLDDPISFRPICKYGSRCFRFTIEDTMKIINTVDNSTIVKTGAYTYYNPSRYGKKMSQINLTDSPSVVNVYNKRVDSELDVDTTAIKITNGGNKGPKIETTTQTIRSFLDGANVVVTVQQLPAYMVELTD